jgi:Transposase
MRDSHEVLARLRAFRSKFEGLLASARKRAARARVAPAHRPTRLRELTGFGANPGDSIAELCRREGIVQNLYYRWSKDFLEARTAKAPSNLACAHPG